MNQKDRKHQSKHVEERRARIASWQAGDLGQPTFLPKARFDKDPLSHRKITNQRIATDSAGGGSGWSHGYGKQHTRSPNKPVGRMKAKPESAINHKESKSPHILPSRA